MEHNYDIYLCIYFILKLKFIVIIKNLMVSFSALMLVYFLAYFGCFIHKMMQKNSTKIEDWNAR